MKREAADANRIIAGILKTGSIMSIILMVAGLGIFLAGRYESPGVSGEKFMGFRQALAGVLHLEPFALMTMGILVLLLTPFFRVAGAVFTFWLVERDGKYALISLAVLAILIAAMFVPEFS